MLGGWVVTSHAGQISVCCRISGETIIAVLRFRHLYPGSLLWNPDP
jgi:hypothetical protein